MELQRKGRAEGGGKILRIEWKEKKVSSVMAILDLLFEVPLR